MDGSPVKSPVKAKIPRERRKLGQKIRKQNKRKKEKIERVYKIGLDFYW